MGIQVINKRGMTFKDMFFSLIVVSMIVIAVGVIINDWGTAYNTGTISDLGEYNQIENIKSEVQVDQSSISVSDIGDVNDNAESNTYRGAFGIISGIPRSAAFGYSMISSVGNRFNIPNYIVTGIILMIAVAIVFTIVAIVFRLLRGTA